MVRITGGRLKGHRISVPRGRGVRPTQDRVREALFQILTNRLGLDWSGVSVVDLFAGTGLLGLEALSRGAEGAVFVERSGRQCGMIREALRRLGLEQRASVVKGDALAWLRKWGAWDEAAQPSLPAEGRLVIMADPPYGKGLSQAVVEAVSTLPLPWEILMVEEGAGCALNLPPGLETCHEARRYGDTVIHLFG